MQSKFARNMMAQKLMSENKDNPFNSRFFQPSDAMAAPTRQGFSNLLSKMEQRDKQGTDVFPALAIGSGFAPSAGISDVLGFAPDPFNPGQTLPSFSENIDRGNYLDAGLQTLGAGGDVMLAASPFAPLLLAPAAAMKMTSQIGKALRGGSKVTETSKLFESVKKFPALSKSEETLVASSSAPVNEIAGLGRVKIEKIDPKDLEGSKKRFDELKALTSGYKQDRAKAKIIRLENGENAIQYMQPPTEVKKLNISELIATQDNVVLGTNKTAGDVMPLVVKKDGKFFIRDGHHRIAQNINSGDKTADVRVIDLDKGGFLGVKATKSLDDIKPGQTLYRYEKSEYSSPDTGAIFYSPDKSYAELYNTDSSLLKTSKVPDKFLDIRTNTGQEKAINWINKEIDKLEKAEIPRTSQDIKLAKQFLKQKDAQGISSSLANLNIIYSKQLNTKINPGLAEKKMMGSLDFDAMTIREAGRDGKEDFSIAFRKNPSTKSLDDIKNKYPNVDLSVFSKPEGITLSKIVVPKDARSEGIGSKVMKDLIKYADENNLPIALTPDSSFGGSKTRLKSFYRNFGFKDNKGRNKDFSFRESMIRQPKSK